MVVGLAPVGAFIGALSRARLLVPSVGRGRILSILALALIVRASAAFRREWFLVFVDLWN
jgi:hypothetical protein